MTGNWRKNGILTHWMTNGRERSCDKIRTDLKTGDATLDLYIDWQAITYKVILMKI